MSNYLRTVELCPACGAPSAEAVRLFHILQLGEPSSVLECRACGLKYKQFAPTDAGLERVYSAGYVHFQTGDSPVTLAEINSAKQKLARCQKLLGDSIPAHQVSLVDVGCGSGGFVSIARRLGYLAEGMDPHLPPELQDSFLYRKAVGDDAARSFEIASLLNVVEHLTEPRQLFASVRGLLKPGGVMLLTCPYGNSLACRIYRSGWCHLSLEEHLLFWTPSSLTRLLRGVGFQGPISYRIAGSPFPYGRVEKELTAPQKEQRAHLQPKVDGQSESFQARIWHLARAIQRQRALGNLVRHVVDLTHSGDYLEYAIGVGTN